MGTDSNRQIEPFHYHLRKGYIFVNTEPSLISAVLGSAVAVCIWDRVLGIGGMSHFEYPRPGRLDKPTARYGSVAVVALIRMLLQMGAHRENLEALVFGGGHRYTFAADMGHSNIKAARRALKKSSIPIISEDVGGSQCRRLLYHTRTNEVLCMKTSKSQQGDWYPYYLSG